MQGPSSPQTPPHPTVGRKQPSIVWHIAPIHDRIPWRKAAKIALQILLDTYQTYIGVVVLGFVVPFLVMMCTHVFSLTESFLNAFTYAFAAINIISLYCMVFTYLSTIFSWQVLRPAVLRLGAPLMLANIFVVELRYLHDIQTIAAGSYLLFFIFLWRIYRWIEHSKVASSHKGVYFLQGHIQVAKDGTPSVLLFGVFWFMVAYGLFSYVLNPYYITAGFFSKLILRGIIVPIIFGCLSSLQTMFLLDKSPEMTEYRLIQPMGVDTSVAILGRFMTADVDSLAEMMVLVLVTGFLEVIWDLIYVRFFDQIQDIKTRLIPPFLRRRLVAFTAGEAPGISLNTRQSLDEESRVGSEAASPFPLNPSTLQAITALDIEGDAEDVLKNSSHKSNRTGQTTATTKLADMPAEVRHRNYLHFRNLQLLNYLGIEFQVILTTPWLLFLCHPIQKYLHFSTLSSIRSVMSAIAIQLGAEFFVKWIIVAIEVRVVGLSPFARLSRTPEYLLSRTTILTACILLATNAFFNYHPPSLDL